MTGTGTATIRTATPTDLNHVSRLLAAAFHGGDLAPWLIPNPAERARIYPGYFAILAEHALTHGQVDLIDDVTVAIWYTLGEDPQIDIADYDQRLADAVGGRYLARFVALDTAMHAHHPVDQPHHYLAFLAAHPDRQGHGYGSLLLRHHLQSLDAAGIPSYLEATGHRNQTLYQRYGYTSWPPYAIGGESSPPLYPMWRGACAEPAESLATRTDHR